MKTGYFSKHGKMPGVVAISRSVPKFYDGPRFLELAPTYEMLRMPREEYNQCYKKILMNLAPARVFNSLTLLAGREPILLCWERSNTWCHRRLVAEWLEMTLGIEVTEVGFARADVLPYKRLPHSKS